MALSYVLQCIGVGCDMADKRVLATMFRSDIGHFRMEVLIPENSSLVRLGALKAPAP